MEWKIPDKQEWACRVCQDGLPTLDLEKVLSVSTEDGELGVIFTDANGKTRAMILAASTWRTIEIYVPAPAPKE